jgi:hypothetical protein
MIKYKILSGTACARSLASQRGYLLLGAERCSQEGGSRLRSRASACPSDYPSAQSAAERHMAFVQPPTNVAGAPSDRFNLRCGYEDTRSFVVPGSRGARTADRNASDRPSCDTTENEGEQRAIRLCHLAQFQRWIAAACQTDRTPASPTTRELGHHLNQSHIVAG